ncbi:MAG TPA: GH116 family glycosyl hydrolase [Polyangiaceae bacterium]|nr:GH116 family glycosyl hydrolase [Polyangiaceae bacterium]
MSSSSSWPTRLLALAAAIALGLACGVTNNSSPATDGGGGASGTGGSVAGGAPGSAGSVAGSAGGSARGGSGGTSGSTGGTLADASMPSGPSPISIPEYAWTPPPNATNPDGAPIGGLGAGTISWRFDGMFYLTRLDVAADGGDGFPSHHTDPNAGFSMYQNASGKVTTKLLNASDPGGNPGTYYSLFPKAWFDYGNAGLSCKVQVEQFSPIIPGDYQRTAYPVGVYKWQIQNPTNAPCDVAVMLTWNNSYSGNIAKMVSDSSKGYTGLTLGRTDTSAPTQKNQGEFTIASAASSGVTVTYQSGSLATLQSAFNSSGELSNTTGNDSTGGLAFKVTVAPNQTTIVPMVLSWDIPIAQTGTGDAWYREYTRTYGRSGESSWKMATEALDNYPAWEAQIDAWQGGILNDSKYPDWLKETLFNELYYYFTGGAIWEAGAASGQADDPNEDKFSSLESYLYPDFGTSDVAFYGSWALALQWPEIDKVQLKVLCDSIVANPHAVGRPPPIGTCAHDVGGRNTLWSIWNDYTYRDSTKWKDLNSKLVLMIYRDWLLTGKNDTAFLQYCYPAIQGAMNKTKSEDSNNDGLPDSTGVDQTYDNLGLTGDTAYCGSLFLAADEAASAIATQLGDTKQATTYDNWLAQGKAAFESVLWNGGGNYYNMDATDQRIMSDQLAGEWYAKALGLSPIVPAAHATAAFQKVYDDNFKNFDSGQHGIVNVTLANGQMDTSVPEQTSSVWVGVAWGAIAGMVQEGLTQQASEAGQTMHDSIWNEGAYWFATPEAWQSGLQVPRAFYYMRPGSVWAVKYGYDLAQ